MEKIKDSIFKFLRLDNLVGNLSGYFEARVQLIKIEIREEIARVLSHALTIGVLLVLSLLFVLFVSFGLANYLNDYFKNSSAGYWIVAAIYGVPGLLIFLLRGKISHYFEQHLNAQSKKRQK
jgi:uncharacterized membrane protein YqjE